MSVHSQARRLRHERWDRRTKWTRRHIKLARKEIKAIEKKWIAEGALDKNWRRKSDKEGSQD